jgi:electron transfer flavoprotein alpha subunit
MIEDLARALGGVVGASRPLTDDLRWLPPEAKVGLSGVTVRPRLYVACGISGQIEHNVGMREAGIVVAINSDPNAPIMSQADYRVVADLHEVVPALTRALDGLS